mmetsp:Transcript_13379/g.34077  ORF Transcript_13379/g.34077 Transcript_13379/m.34077 type:complete len:210 (+) Transcript_13379:349-978(+)
MWHPLAMQAAGVLAKGWSGRLTMAAEQCMRSWQLEGLPPALDVPSRGSPEAEGKLALASTVASDFRTTTCKTQRYPFSHGSWKLFLCLCQCCNAQHVGGTSSSFNTQPLLHQAFSFLHLAQTTVESALAVHVLAILAFVRDSGRASRRRLLVVGNLSPLGGSEPAKAHKRSNLILFVLLGERRVVNPVLGDRSAKLIQLHGLARFRRRR